MNLLPEKVYTEKDLTHAKDTERLIGWLQGAGVVVVGGVLWNLLGWIPAILGLVAVGWVVLKLMSPKDRGELEE
jgi:hypothetical protein